MDDPEQEDCRNVVQMRLKRLLSKMGFAWRPLLRECVDLVIKRKDRITRLARWTFAFRRLASICLMDFIAKILLIQVDKP
jgi:hypothetical protein